MPYETVYTSRFTFVLKTKICLITHLKISVANTKKKLNEKGLMRVEIVNCNRRFNIGSAVVWTLTNQSVP